MDKDLHAAGGGCAYTQIAAVAQIGIEVAVGLAQAAIIIFQRVAAAELLHRIEAVTGHLGGVRTGILRGHAQILAGAVIYDHTLHHAAVGNVGYLVVRARIKGTAGTLAFKVLRQEHFPRICRTDGQRRQPGHEHGQAAQHGHNSAETVLSFHLQVPQFFLQTTAKMQFVLPY